MPSKEKDFNKLRLLASDLVVSCGSFVSGHKKSNGASVTEAIGLATQLIVDAGNSAQEFFNDREEK